MYVTVHMFSFLADMSRYSTELTLSGIHYSLVQSFSHSSLSCLSGLEAFSSHQPVVSCLQQMAVEKILLMQRLEPCQQNETPSVVLYDTSQDDDININSACLKALQDEDMCNPLCVSYYGFTMTVHVNLISALPPPFSGIQ